MKLKGIMGYCSVLLAVPTLAALNRTVLPHPLPERAITVIPDLFLAILFARAFFRRYVRGGFLFTIPDLLAALLCAYSAAFIFPDASKGILGFRISGARILLYFAIRFQDGRDGTSPGTRDDEASFLSSIAKMLFAVGVLGYLIVLALPEATAQAWYKANSFVIGYYAGIRRMDSIFWSPVAFGSAMAFASLIFFNRFLQDSRFSVRMKSLMAFLFLSSCNLLSMSRGAWVYEAAGSLLLLAWHRDKFRSLAIALLAVVLLGSIFATSDSLKRQLSSMVSTTEAGTGQIPRFNQRKEGIASVLDNPLGYGVGSSGYIGARVRGPIKAVTDNWYIKTAQELGIVGLALYCILFVSLIFMAAKTGLDPGLKPQFPYLAILFGFLLEAYGSNIFDFDFMGSIFWIMTGFMMNNVRLNNPEPSHA